MVISFKNTFLSLIAFVLCLQKGYSVDELYEESQLLSNILKTAGWMEYNDKVALHPGLPMGETVSYCGNVTPTTLYKKDKHSILPTAPYVHPYNPIFDYDYVSLALELKPTEAIKNFFSVPDLSRAFVVFQKVIETGEPQLLRLHGFVHGAGAGSVNSNTGVATEIKPIHGISEIKFAGGFLNKADSVHTHGGVASPNNFTLQGFKPEIFESMPCWQSMALYLPASKTATLLVFGQRFLNYEMSLNLTEPVLDNEAGAYLTRLLER